MCSPGPRNPRTQLQSSALSGGLSHCPENAGQQLDSCPVLTWPASDRQRCLSSRILPWHPLSSHPPGTSPTAAPFPTGPLCPSPGPSQKPSPFLSLTRFRHWPWRLAGPRFFTLAVTPSVPHRVPMRKVLEVYVGVPRGIYPRDLAPAVHAAAPYTISWSSRRLYRSVQANQTSLS